jgi:lactate permease
MAGSQYLLAVSGLWDLAGFLAGVVGLGASLLVSRLPFYDRAGEERHSEQRPDRLLGKTTMSFATAVAAYGVLTLIVSLAELVGPIHDILNSVALQLSFPATETTLGWTVQAATGKKISIFGHPGALLFYTSVFAYGFYRLKGYLKKNAWRRVLVSTGRNAVKSSIGIISMVCMAMIMDQTGMTRTIAMGLSASVEGAIPLLSPFVGLLGAFMTGSNTNSNVIFTGLQRDTAELVGLPVTLILAAQTTGGSLGSMLAPAKVIVGCSTAGLAGKEGQVLRRTIVYGILIAAVVGILTWIISVRLT